MNDRAENDRYRKFINAQLLLNESLLVERLIEMEFEGFTYENIRNLYDEEYQEPRNVFEWWRCDPRLLQLLEDRNEPILKNEFGEWWGRCTTGQSCYLDDVLYDIWLALTKPAFD